MPRPGCPTAPRPRGIAHSYRSGDGQVRCYAAPAVRIPLAPIRARPRRPAGPDRAVPGPGLPRFFVLRRRRPSARRRPRLQRRLHLDLRRGRRHDPGRPGPADPLERPLDAAGVVRPGRRSSGSSARRRVASALPFVLIGSLAAPLTWAIARDAGARDRSWRSAPASWPRSRRLSDGLHGPARQLRALPAAGRRRAVDGRARAQGRRRARSRWPACSPGWRRSRATTACWCWRRSGSRSSGTAGGRGARPARGRPPIPLVRGRRRLRRPASLLVMGPWWIRQLAVFGSISPSTASGKVLFIRDIGEWNSITTPATARRTSSGRARAAPRDPGRRARRGARDLHDARRRRSCWLPFMVIGGWARRRSLDFGPFFLYAGILFAFSALVSAVHVPGGTFIHSAVALAPHAYILALEGVAVAVAWIAARGPRWDAETRRRRVFIGAHRRRSSSSWRSPARVVRPGSLGRTPRQRIAVAAALDRAGAAPGRPDHVDRRRRDQVLDRPRRRRHAERPASRRSSRSPRLRHRVARPRARRHGRGARAGPRRGDAAGLDRRRRSSRSRRGGGDPALSRLSRLRRARQ